MSTSTRTWPSIAAQAERLIELGVDRISGLPADEIRRMAAGSVVPDTGDALLVLPAKLAPASLLAPLLRHGGKPGFVVVDMPDLDDFLPIEGVTVPGTAISGARTRARR